VSLAVEEQVLLSLSAALMGIGAGEDGEEARTASLIKFMSDVRGVVNALVLGAGLEGVQPSRLVEEYSFEDGVPRAKALVVAGRFAFIVLAKPFIDVADIDVLVDEAGSVEAEGLEEVVPVAVGYEYSYDAERYAKSIGVEILRLGY